MFGQVTHTLDAAAKRVRSCVLCHSHSVTPTSVVLCYQKRLSSLFETLWNLQGLDMEGDLMQPNTI